MNNLLKRALSGTVYVALIVGTCLFSTLGFGILMLVFGVIGIYEFHNVTSDRKASITTRCGILSLDIIGVMSLLLLALASRLMIGSAGFAAPESFMYVGMFCSLLVLYVIARVGFSLFQRSGNPTAMLSHSALGVIYLSVGLGSAIVLDEMSNGLALLIFIFIWLNDTGAYFSGMTFGRHKLCVHLSPKKTWEGFFGGLLICIAAGVVFSLTGFGAYLMPLIPWMSSLTMLGFILPISVVLFSTCGDLFESMIKRNYGVKDSGNIIPGHGGVLDRIDSMLFAMPGTALIIVLYVMVAF